MIALIASLTALDIVCTWFGVSRGFIYEANPIIAHFFQMSVPLSCLGAAVMTGLMLWFVARHINQYRWVRPALMCVAVVKVAIIAVHACWIVPL